MTVIVDGNNLFQALHLDQHRNLAPAEKFIQKLELAAASFDWEVTVIFDGPQRFLPRESGLLVVRYAVGKTADTLIEQMVYQTPDRTQVVVVTQDRAEADLVLGLGARVWNANRLMEEMNRHGTMEG